MNLTKNRKNSRKVKGSRKANKMSIVDNKIFKNISDKLVEPDDTSSHKEELMVEINKFIEKTYPLILWTHSMHTLKYLANHLNLNPKSSDTKKELIAMILYGVMNEPTLFSKDPMDDYDYRLGLYHQIFYDVYRRTNPYRYKF